MFILPFILAIFAFQLVQATIYVIAPLSGSTCNGGESCLVQWVDNGVIPLLDDIGPCHVGLYNGQHVLVQQIQPVDVSTTHSFQFTPDPKAGPGSSDYYINFTSVNPIGSSASRYSQFSPFFKLTDMSGSFDSPVQSDTSTLLVPSSVANPLPNSISTTIIISPASPSTHLSSTSLTSLPSSTPASPTSAASSFVTSRTSSLPSTASPSAPVSTSGASTIYHRSLTALSLSLSFAVALLSDHLTS